MPDLLAPDPVAIKLAASDAAALSEFDAPEPELTLPPEKKEEIPLDEKKPEEKVEEKKEEEIAPTEDDIQKRLDEIQPKKNAHPNTTKGYTALKNIIVEVKEKLTKSEEARKSVDSKLAALETEYKGKVITPELESELVELRQLRREFH